MPKQKKKVRCMVYSRIVGYIRPLPSWAVHKQHEFDQRQTYVIKAMR